jgi:hypothetical protein
VDLRHKIGVYIYISKEVKRLNCGEESTTADLYREG